MSEPKYVSTPTLKRLPKYLNYLRRLQGKGEKNISASTISRDLGIQHTQVRKDLAVTGVQGVPKVGHKIDILIEAIEKFLCWDSITNACLIGAGHMGTALLGYKAFQKTVLNIAAAFDVDQNKIGSTIHDTPVYHIDKLGEVISQKNLKIGIITTTASQAQNAAEILVNNGIKAIWNFSHVNLSLPKDVTTVDVEFDSSLAILSYYYHKLDENSGVQISSED